MMIYQHTRNLETEWESRGCSEVKQWDCKLTQFTVDATEEQEEQRTDP